MLPSQLRLAEVARHAATASWEISLTSPGDRLHSRRSSRFSELVQ
jgi:hypothetical protein